MKDKIINFLNNNQFNEVVLKFKERNDCKVNLCICPEIGEDYKVFYIEWTEICSPTNFANIDTEIYEPIVKVLKELGAECTDNDGCPYCRMLYELLEERASEFLDKINIDNFIIEFIEDKD